MLWLYISLGAVVMVTLAASLRAAIEEPPFRLIEKIGDIEFRAYGIRLAAETYTDGSEEEALEAGFKTLAEFIFGKNAKKNSRSAKALGTSLTQPSEGIAMTSPVEQGLVEQGRWRIRFFMPAKYSAASLPAPLNPAVGIVEVPGETVAVLRFSDSRDAASVLKRTAQLLKILPSTRWVQSGPPVSSFYDPPWTLPFLRRNEVAVPVRRP
jgi:SOUL heme-binding protein